MCWKVPKLFEWPHGWFQSEHIKIARAARKTLHTSNFLWLQHVKMFCLFAACQMQFNINFKILNCRVGFKFVFVCSTLVFSSLPGFSGKMHSAGGFLVRPGYAGYRQHFNYQQGQHMQGPQFDWNVRQNYDTLQYSTLQYSANILPIADSSKCYTVFFTLEEERKQSSNKW